jgi:hypothetical protein
MGLIYRALSRPRTQKKPYGDFFTARQQVVGCSKNKIVRTRGHRIKETQKITTANNWPIQIHFADELDIKDICRNTHAHESGRRLIVGLMLRLRN